MKPKKIIENTDDLTKEEINLIINAQIKEPPDISGKSMALLFFNPSTRTRLSFVNALNSLKMNPVTLNPLELRYLDGESLKDTALSISQYVDIIGIRVNSARPIHTSLAVPTHSIGNQYFNDFSQATECPVINMECDNYHPCQGLADLKTISDNIGFDKSSKITISWAYSSSALRIQAMPIELITLLPRFVKHTVLSCPEEFMLKESYINTAKQNAQQNNNQFTITHDFKEGCKDTTVIYARNWVSSKISSHRIETEKELHRKYSNWKLTDKIFNGIAKNARYMHCMPIHRGCEAESSVIDSFRSLITRQMKNRVVVQRELIKFLLG